MAKDRIRISRRLLPWQYVVLVVAAVASIFGGYQGYDKVIAPQRTNAATLNTINNNILILNNFIRVDTFQA